MCAFILCSFCHLLSEASFQLWHIDCNIVRWTNAEVGTTNYSTAPAMLKKNKKWRTKTLLSAPLLQKYSPRSMGEHICGKIWLLRSVLISHNKDIQLLRKTIMHQCFFPYHLRVQKRKCWFFQQSFVKNESMKELFFLNKGKYLPNSDCEALASTVPVLRCIDLVLPVGGRALWMNEEYVGGSRLGTS